MALLLSNVYKKKVVKQYWAKKEKIRMKQDKKGKRDDHMTMARQHACLMVRITIPTLENIDECIVC